MKSAPPVSSSSSNKKTKLTKKGDRSSKLTDRSQLNINVAESIEEKLSNGKCF
jgi:hypothetical protein